MDCPKCGLLCPNTATRCDCGQDLTGSRPVQMNGAPTALTVGQVVVTDIRMPFASMVGFMVKWALASIPAMFILGMLGFFLTAIFGGLLAGVLRPLLH